MTTKQQEEYDEAALDSNLTCSRKERDMATPQPIDEKSSRLLELQIEKLALENERMRIETNSLRNKGKLGDTLLRYIPLLTVLLTVAGFGFGIYQYRAQQKENLKKQSDQSNNEIAAREAQAQKDTETAQREFMKPLLQKQLSLYFEASESVATIANTTDAAERSRAINTFWRLYQGPLIVVESKEASSAMAEFGNCLRGTRDCDKAELNRPSLALSSRVQESVLASWKANPEDFSSDKFHYR